VYDVVVAGGSFAGLTLATSVRGRVALVEKDEVGEGQTSACVTTLDVIKKLGLEPCVEEAHDEAVVHLHSGVVRFRLPYQFCSFDYRTFCTLLLERFDGDLLQEPALRAVPLSGAGAAAVVTSRRTIEGGAVVDATGCRAVLACSLDGDFSATDARTYGLEKPALGFDSRGIHFYFDRDIRVDGYGWAFPAADVCRAGVLSYVAPDGVRDSTAAFLRAEGMHSGHYHGGYLSAALRPATAGDLFLVGDAAGHCLPLSGEGIRPAVYFAQRLALALNDELGGRCNRGQVRHAYRALQAGYQRRYQWLRRAQRLLQGWPDPPLGAFFRTFAGEGWLYRYVSGLYWQLAAPVLPFAELRPARIRDEPMPAGATAR